MAVIPFSKPSQLNEAPCLQNLVKKTQDLAKDSENISFYAPHAQQRMVERKITIRQVLEVLRNGTGVAGPTLDQYGDWRIKLKRLVAGRRVQVVVAVKQNHLEVITVM